jgi:hypothetical protein
MGDLGGIEVKPSAKIGSVKGYQLPVSATRWQHWSWICFATFFGKKNQKISNNQATTEAREKIRTY